MDEALRLAALGLTKASIAKKLSLGEATVYRILARENVKKQSKSQN
jgi:DNA invertase Pin-like site-specific DNA recombinase